MPHIQQITDCSLPIKYPGDQMCNLPRLIWWFLFSSAKHVQILLTLNMLQLETYDIHSLQSSSSSDLYSNLNNMIIVCDNMIPGNVMDS